MTNTSQWGGFGEEIVAKAAAINQPWLMLKARFDAGWTVEEIVAGVKKEETKDGKH